MMKSTNMVLFLVLALALTLASGIRIHKEKKSLQASCWNQVSGAANDIGVGADGSVWMIGTNSAISKYESGLNTWNTIPGGATRISVDPSGIPWVVNGGGAIYQGTAAGGWIGMPSAATDIGVGADGSVWIIATNAVSGGYGISKYDKTLNTWTTIPGGGVRIAVDPSGIPWVVQNNGSILQGTAAGGWNYITSLSCAKDIGIGADGTVAVVGCNLGIGGGTVYTLNPKQKTNWTSLAGGGVDIAVDPSGSPWVVTSSSQIFDYTCNQNKSSSCWNQVSGAATDIGVGADGSVWKIGINAVCGGYDISKYESGLSTWNIIPGGAVRISVDPSGIPWLVNGGGTIYQGTAAGGWIGMPGAATDIGVGADGSVWIIATNAVSGGYGISKLDKALNTWTTIPGGGVRIAVDPSGIPWVVQNNGSILQGTAAGGWNYITSLSCAKDIGIGADGTVAIAGCNLGIGGGTVYTLNPNQKTNWTSLTAGAVDIAVGPSGSPWLVTSSNQILDYTCNQNTSSCWDQLSGAATDIGVGADGTVWKIGINAVCGGYDISKYESDLSTWNTIPGGAVRISVDPSGIPWLVNGGGTIYQGNGAGGWIGMPGAATDVGVGADGSVWIIATNAVSGGYGISKYNKASNTWTTIPGGGVRIAVDPSGLPWIVQNNGSVFQGTAAGGWNYVASSCAKDIGIGADGTVAIVGCNLGIGGGTVYTLNPKQNGNWIALSRGGVDIAVGPSGSPLVVTSPNEILNYTCNQYVVVLSGFPCSGPTKDSSWTYYPSFTTITCPGTGYTYIGPYGSGGKATSSAISLPVHKGLSVSLQLAFIDSWDGEAFKISANGVLVYSQTHEYHTQSFSNSCGTAKYDDAYTSVTFGFNDTSSSLTLLVTSGLDEAASNEAWGICDLKVQISTCPVLADGTVTGC